MLSDEELDLLKKLGSGALDGVVGDPVYMYGGGEVWLEIADGTPRQFKGRSGDGTDEPRVLREWTSDGEKLAFLRKYGWLMEDGAAGAYSERTE